MKPGNLKIGTRLFAAFGIMAVLILAMCGIGYRALKVTGAAVDIILEEEVPIADATMEAMISLREAQDSVTEQTQKLPVETQHLSRQVTPDGQVFQKL